MFPCIIFLIQDPGEVLVLRVGDLRPSFKAESVLMNEMENYVQPYSEMFSSADWCPQSDWPFLMKHWAAIDPIVHLFRLGVLLTSAYTSLVLGDECS